MHAHQKQGKPHSLSKKILAYVCGLAALGAIIQIIFYLNPGARVDFQTFEPKKLPDGLSAQVATVEIWSNRIWFTIGIGLDWPVPYKVVVSQNLGRAEAFLVQQKDKGQFDYSCPGDGTLEVCEPQRTKLGQEYVRAVQTFSSPSTLAYEYVTFVKNGTLINMTVKADVSQLTPLEQWNDSIDSFVPAPVGNLKANYFTPGP